MYYGRLLELLEEYTQRLEKGEKIIQELLAEGKPASQHLKHFAEVLSEYKTLNWLYKSVANTKDPDLTLRTLAKGVGIIFPGSGHPA